VDRDTAVTLCVAFVAVVAFGVAAATLNTAVVLGGGDGGSGFGSGTVEEGAGSGAGSGPLFPGDFTGEFEPICFPVLREPAVVAGIGIAAAGGVALLYLYLREWFSTIVVSGVAAIPVGVVWTLLAFCGKPLDETVRDSETGVPIPSSAANETWIPLLGGGSGESSGAVVSAPTAVVFVLVGIALLGGVAVVLASRGDDAAEPDAPEPSTPAEPDVAAVARVAGQAADRIADDATVDNEVFRAWAAMTEALDLESPETTTPAAFETAAVEAGMDPSDVAELRRLFEEVRYGGEAASDEREQQAIAALRRVEDEYGELDATGAET
jgi:hypothetical protein